MSVAPLSIPNEALFAKQDNLWNVFSPQASVFCPLQGESFL
jgi:hypothetical protein